MCLFAAKSQNLGESAAAGENMTELEKRYIIIKISLNCRKMLAKQVYI